MAVNMPVTKCPPVASVSSVDKKKFSSASFALILRHVTSVLTYFHTNCSNSDFFHFCSPKY